jgi:transposase
LGRPSPIGKTLSIVFPAKSRADILHRETKTVCKWGTSNDEINGEMLQTYIQRAFSISYHQNSIYTLLKSLNITWTTSRSKHPQQSEEAQDNIKKTSD